MITQRICGPLFFSGAAALAGVDGGRMIGALNLRTDLRVALCRRSELSATPANKSMQTAAQTEIPTPRSGMRRRVTEFGRLRSLGGLSRRTLNEA